MMACAERFGYSFLEVQRLSFGVWWPLPFLEPDSLSVYTKSDIIMIKFCGQELL